MELHCARVSSARHAVALRRADGSLVVFGRAGRGALAEPLEQVVQLQATRDAFAALRLRDLSNEIYDST